MNRKRTLVAAGVVAIAGAAAFLTYQFTTGGAEQMPAGIVNPAFPDGQRTEQMPELVEGVTPRPSEEMGSYRMPAAGKPSAADKPKKQ